MSRRFGRLNRLSYLALSMLLLAASTVSYAEEAEDCEPPPDASGTPKVSDTLGRSASETARLLRYLDGTLSSPPDEDGADVSVANTQEALERLAESMFTNALLPLSDELSALNLSTYDRIAAQREVFDRLASALNACFDEYYGACMRIVCRDLRSSNIPLISTLRERSALGWREAAALYRAYGSDTAARLAGSMDVGLSLQDGSAGFTCAFSDNDRMFSEGTREQLLTGKFTLAYLYTVYTDEGERTDYETPALSEEYLSTLAHPLPGCTIKNGWYAPRSSSTRLHTGTDIRANRGTPILSVTDGVVLYIGFSKIPGYYVIIRDPSGYEYHYYHMVKQSDLVYEGEEVTQGQPIGLVGSTGNSVANHLHLSIITPEGRYINPYDVFMQAGIGPIRTSG